MVVVGPVSVIVVVIVAVVVSVLTMVVVTTTVIVRAGRRTFLTPSTVTILPRRVISNVRVADAAGLLPTASPTSTPTAARPAQARPAGTTSHRGNSPNSQRSRAINARMQVPSM